MLQDSTNICQLLHAMSWVAQKSDSLDICVNRSYHRTIMFGHVSLDWEWDDSLCGLWLISFFTSIAFSGSPRTLFSPLRQQPQPQSPGGHTETPGPRPAPCYDRGHEIQAGPHLRPVAGADLCPHQQISQELWKKSHENRWGHLLTTTTTGKTTSIVEGNMIDVQWKWISLWHIAAYSYPGLILETRL